MVRRADVENENATGDQFSRPVLQEQFQVELCLLLKLIAFVFRREESNAMVRYIAWLSRQPMQRTRRIADGHRIRRQALFVERSSGRQTEIRLVLIDSIEERGPRICWQVIFHNEHLILVLDLVRLHEMLNHSLHGLQRVKAVRCAKVDNDQWVSRHDAYVERIYSYPNKCRGLINQS